MYNLTRNLNDIEHSLIEPNHVEHTTTHCQPPRRSISQPTQSLFLGVGHSLSHGLLNSLLSPLSLPLSRKIDSPNLKACRAAADWEDLVSPFTGSNQAINDKKHVGLFDSDWGGERRSEEEKRGGEEERWGGRKDGGWKRERERERERIKRKDREMTDEEGRW